MKKSKKTILAVLVLLAITIACLTSCGNAFADQASKDSLYKKGLLQGYYNCVQGTNSMSQLYLKENLTTDMTVGAMYDEGVKDPSEYYLPTNKGKSFFSVWSYNKKDIANCYNIIRGGDDPNIYKVFGVTVPGYYLTDDFLVNKLGYFKRLSSGEVAPDTTTKCFYGTYTKIIVDKNTGATDAAVSEATDKFCVDYDKDGKGVSGSVSSGRQLYGFDYSSDSGSFVLIKVTNGVWKDTVYDIKVVGRTESEIVGDLQPILSSRTNTTPQECSFSNAYAGGPIGSCDKAVGEPYVDRGTIVHHTYTIVFDKIVYETLESATTAQTSYTYTLMNDGWGGYEGYRAVAALLGYDVPGTKKEDAVNLGAFAVQKMYLTNTERIQLYQWYFDNMMGANVSCAVPSDKKALYEKDGLGPIKWAVGKKIQTGCYATANNIGKETGYHGVVQHPHFSSLYKYSGANESFDTLLQFFKDLDENTPLDSDIDKSAYVDADPTDAEAIHRASEEAAEADFEEKERTCYDSAGSSNWIACPIIENSKDTSTKLYSFIENMLQTNTELFNLGSDNTGKGNGTFVAWSKFRDYANIVFIIVFIIVILSQVTGLGIDNYGVKKILPKIILGAVLVNVSYFVCQASVDVGNITGGGVKRLFETILSDIGLSDANLYASFDGVKAAQGLIVGSAAGILAAVIFAAYKLSGGTIVVALILAAIGVVIGIFFLLVLLAVRQGLAVILVVISPLAFIAYMLPNTKGLFSKWLKLLSATLLAYPICSLVVYGGQMVSNIILMAAASDGVVSNFALLITSAILSIAPVFFIPSLIMKSMSGVATVANGLKARATSLGKSAFDRSNTADTMRNVAAAKRENMAVNRARKTKAALEEKQKSGKLSIGDRARLRTAQNAIAGLDRKNADLYSGMTRSKSKDELFKMGEDAFVDGYDAEKFDAAVAQLFATGNDEDAFKLIQSVSANTSNMNTEQLEKFKTTLATRGGTIGKAYAKVLGKSDKPIDFGSAMSGGQMADAFRGMGTNAVAGMTKDELSFLSKFDLKKVFKDKEGNEYSTFTDEQLALAAATHTSGKAGDNFGSLLGATAQASAVKSRLSAEQWAKASEATLAALGFTAADNDKMAQSIIESGDGELMSSISGRDQRAAFDRLSQQKAAAEAAQKEAAAKAQATKAKREMQAQDSQQRFQQRMVQAMEEIKNNMNQPPKNPPETFSDGAGI